MKAIKILILFAALGSLIGCATMFNSGSQMIQAHSAQGLEGVPVEIKTPHGSYTTKLPTTIVSRPSTFQDIEIRLTDKCYNQNITIVPKTITASYWANIFNIYGFGIDPLSGAMWAYDSNLSVITEKNGDCK